MQSRIHRKAPIPISSNRLEIRAALDPLAAEPNALRDAVCRALLSISIDERSAFHNQLLDELRKAGIRVRECLFMLGASAATTEELTPPEIAALIRYVRLVKPNAMTAVAGTLKDLLIAADVPAEVSGRAA